MLSTETKLWITLNLYICCQLMRNIFLQERQEASKEAHSLERCIDSAVHKDMYSFVRGYEFIGVDSFPQGTQPRACLCGYYCISSVWLVQG